MPSSGAAAQPLTVAAASDLRFAFEEIGLRFEEQTGHPVIFTFGSSGQLTQQIENGAPFDVFASANTAYVDQLRAKGLIIPGTATVYAQGRIVLAVNKTSGVHATRLEDLTTPTIMHIAIANPEHAPYGMAAMQALQAVNLWELLRPKLVYGENVRQALQFVQSGNAEAGIIALSIAQVPEITWTLIDDRLHRPINQALAVLRGTKQEALARQFIAFVEGSQGRSILKKYGFRLPDEF